MNNRINYISKMEAEKIKKDALKNKAVFFAEIEGNEIKTEEDYVEAMANAFCFPQELPGKKLDWCNDYICDLMWIKQKNIIFLIRNYDLMLIEHLEVKNNVIADFEEIILPWWEGEIIGHMVDGAPKRFLVYIETIFC